MIALIVAADVAYKRFVEKSQQNLKQRQFEPYRTFIFVALIRVIASALALFATKEVAQTSNIKVVQQL